MPRTHLPVGEKFWSALSEARKPVARSAEMSTQCFVFLCSPKGQIPVQLAHRRIERRAIIPPVVLEPTSNDGIEHPGQIFDRLVTALVAVSSYELLFEWPVPPSQKSPD